MSPELACEPGKLLRIAIKISIGKYTLSVDYGQFMQSALDLNGFSYLHIEPRHTAALITLPYHHRDPFDRLVITQVMVEKISLLSADVVFDQYPIQRLW